MKGVRVSVREDHVKKRVSLFIDLSLDNLFRGLVGDRPNILHDNFFRYIMGTLTETNISMVDIGGTTRTIGTMYDSNADAATIAQDSTRLSTTRTLEILGDRSRVRLEATITASTSALQILQRLIDTSGTAWTISLATFSRSPPIPAGTPIRWHINFLSPMTSNMARLVLGLLSNANVLMYRFDGTGVTIRTADNVNAAAIRVAVLTRSVAPYPDPLPTDLRPYHPPAAIRASTFTDAGTYLSFYFIGEYVPTNDITVYTVAVYQPLFDTGGTSHDIPLMLIPLPSPVVFRKSYLNAVFLSIMASTS